MGHQNKQVDVESLQHSGRRRGRCLDIFLVMSILFLFVLVAAVAVGGVKTVMELQSKLETLRQVSEFGTSTHTGDAPSPTFKMQNFAYLEPTSCHLNFNTTMQWAAVHYGDGTSVGSNFIFNPEQHTLMPQQAGNYFMYVELKITCTYKCSAGLLSVRVSDKLTCEVQLPSNSTSVSRKCWTVSWMDSQKLSTHVSVPEGGLAFWKLELNGSGFGMFLVG